MPQVLVRLDNLLAEELDRIAKSLGVSRAELIRIALRQFIESKQKLRTEEIRGIVRPKMTLRELEEMYQVGR